MTKSFATNRLFGLKQATECLGASVSSSVKWGYRNCLPNGVPARMKKAMFVTAPSVAFTGRHELAIRTLSHLASHHSPKQTLRSFQTGMHRKPATHHATAHLLFPSCSSSFRFFYLSKEYKNFKTQPESQWSQGAFLDYLNFADCSLLELLLTLSTLSSVSHNPV